MAIPNVINVSPSLVHAPAANTAAVVTRAANSLQANHINQIWVSYSAAPTGGNIKIEDGSGNVVFTQDITAAGPLAISFTVPLRGSINTAMIITLAAGSGTVVGKLSVNSWLDA